MTDENRIAGAILGLALVIAGAGCFWILSRYGAAVDVLSLPAREQWDFAAFALVALACLTCGAISIGVACISPRRHRLRRRARAMARDWHR